MNKHLVLTRHDEDLAWLRAVSGCERIVVYDKSPQPLPESVPLRNVGLEPYGHITHILRNWDELPEWLLLCQGFPFDHSCNFLDVCNSPSFETAVELNRQRYPESGLVAPGFLALGRQKLIHRGLIALDPLVAGDPRHLWFHSRKHEILGEVWRHLRPGKPEPAVWPSADGGQSLVHRDVVRRWPRDLYEFLLGLLEQDEVAAYAMENLWWQLWGAEL